MYLVYEYFQTDDDIVWKLLQPYGEATSQEYKFIFFATYLLLGVYSRMHYGERNDFT